MTAPPATTPCIAAYLRGTSHCIAIEFPPPEDWAWFDRLRRRWAANPRYEVRETTYGNADTDMRAGIAERAKQRAGASALARRG